MLDSLFGLGKSKKSRHQTSNEESEDNGYVVVGSNSDPNRSPYPRTIMLNDELIRMGSSSSIVPPQPNSMYPSLDPSVTYPNPKLPYSNDGQHSNQASCRNCSPIDNVPFSINITNGLGGNNGSLDDDDDFEIMNILNRVENFLAACNYDFHLENSILRESYE